MRPAAYCIMAMRGRAAKFWKGNQALTWGDRGTACTIIVCHGVMMHWSICTTQHHSVTIITFLTQATEV